MSGRMVHHRRKRHHMRGRGFMDFVKKVGRFLHKTKIISRVGNILGKAGVPYAGAIGSAAGKLGFGRRRHRRYHRRGGALKLAGQGLGLGGGMRHMGMIRHLRPLRMAY